MRIKTRQKQSDFVLYHQEIRKIFSPAVEHFVFTTYLAIPNDEETRSVSFDILHFSCCKIDTGINRQQCP